MRGSHTTRALLALAAGLAAGIILERTGWPPLQVLARWVEPLGALWVNAIRMTVVPLVVSLVLVGVGGLAAQQDLGRLGLRTMLLFVTILSATAALIAVLAPVSMAGLRIDEATVDTLRASAQTVNAVPAVTSIREWILTIVPTNPIKSMVDTAMLPVFVFTLVLAIAVRRTTSDAARTLLGIMEAIKQASLVLVRWVVAVAPIGVFALALGLGARLGASAVGAIAYFLVVMCGLHVLVGLLMYILARVGAGIPLRAFASAVAPVQIVGLTTRSSMASLPTMFQAADRLGVKPDVASFVLPLALSAFRLSSPVNWTIGALFVARLYGIDFGPSQIALVAVASVLLNPASPAVPSGGLFVQAPVYIATGLPVEGLGILIALDAIPDIFKTLLNVTADVAVVTLADRTVEGAT